MRSTLVWDSPVRLFHWLFAAGVCIAITIGLLADDDSAVFPYHTLIGLTLTVMVILRIAWGFIGTKYARLDSLLVAPTTVVEYLIGVMRGRDTRRVGRNPASAYAVVVMLLLVLLLAGTGIAMATGYEFLKDVHEVLTYALLGVVAVHLLGVVIHTARFREHIALGMIDGRTSGNPEAGIPSSRPLVAVAFLAIVAVWSVMLWRGYDPSTRTTKLPLIGVSLAMGENYAEAEGNDEDQ